MCACTVLDLAFGRPAVGVDDPVALQLQVDHVAFFQVDDLVGGAGQRHRVRGEEVFAFADADDQRRALARADHAVRLVAAKHGDRIGAVQALDRLLHGFEQVAVVHVVDQVGDHFGVGLAFEHIAGGGQFGAQLVMVFDDAVVHQRDALAREMRMGVVRGRRAVRGPARVGDAGEAGQTGFLPPALRGRPRARCCASAAACRRRAGRRRRSRSRGIRAASSLASRMGVILRCATAPTMPHIGDLALNKEDVLMLGDLE